MLKKGLLLLLVLGILASLFVGCGAATNNPAQTENTVKPAAQDTSSEAPKKEIVIGASILTLQDAFYITQKQAMEEAAQKLGVKVIILDAQSDLTKQTNQVNDLIAQKVDAIILVPVDPKAAVDMVKACNAANIPVICNSSDIEADVAVKVLRDDLNLGRTSGENAAKWINNKLGGKAKIAMLNFPTFSNTLAWENGFKEKVKELSPDSSIIATIQATSKEAGLKAMEDILQAHPDVNFVWGVNDPAGLGACAAIEAANRKDIFVTFMCGGDKEAFERLKKGTQEGKVAGIVQIYPYEDGNASLKAAVDIINNKEVPKLINTVGVWWDETNVNENLATYPAYPASMSK